MTIAEQIREQALRLSAEERALIARDLLQSLDVAESPETVESAWLEAMEARAEAYESGQMAADDWQASLARVRQRLRTKADE